MLHSIRSNNRYNCYTIAMDSPFGLFFRPSRFPLVATFPLGFFLVRRICNYSEYHWLDLFLILCINSYIFFWGTDLLIFLIHSLPSLFSIVFYWTAKICTQSLFNRNINGTALPDSKPCWMVYWRDAIVCAVGSFIVIVNSTCLFALTINLIIGPKKRRQKSRLHKQANKQSK